MKSRSLSRNIDFRKTWSVQWNAILFWTVLSIGLETKDIFFGGEQFLADRTFFWIVKIVERVKTSSKFLEISS